MEVIQSSPTVTIAHFRRWSPKGCGCVIFALLSVTFMVILLMREVDSRLRLRNGLIYLAFKSSHEPLKLDQGWGHRKRLEEVSPDEFELFADVKAASPGFRWRTIRVYREPKQQRQHIANFLGRPEVHVFEFSPDAFAFEVGFKCHDEKLPKGRDDFLPSTAREILHAKPLPAVFAVNLNYFDRDPRGVDRGTGPPLGLIISNGKTLVPQRAGWTGYFFVENGKPWFGPASRFEEATGQITEAAQAFPSAMKDGKIFSYILNPQWVNRFFNGGELTFRNLAGVKEDGTVLFVLSGHGGLLNVTEVAQIARLAGARDATLFDGGRVLQYSLKLEKGAIDFSAFNNRVTSLGGFDKGNLTPPQRPPVYLVVRRKIK